MQGPIHCCTGGTWVLRVPFNIKEGRGKFSMNVGLTFVGPQCVVGGGKVEPILRPSFLWSLPFSPSYFYQPPPPPLTTTTTTSTTTTWTSSGLWLIENLHATLFFYLCLNLWIIKFEFSEFIRFKEMRIFFFSLFTFFGWWVFFLYTLNFKFKSEYELSELEQNFINLFKIYYLLYTNTN